MEHNHIWSMGYISTIKVSLVVMIMVKHVISKNKGYKLPSRVLVLAESVETGMITPEWIGVPLKEY